jgi:hypothetical protein
MKHPLIWSASMMSLSLAGCATSPRGSQNTLVQTGGQTISLQGCRPDLVTVWNNNATIKSDGHVVTVDENYLTVDGQFITRPAFKTLTLQCQGKTFKVTVDNKLFGDLLKNKR